MNPSFSRLPKLQPSGRSRGATLLVGGAGHPARTLPPRGAGLALSLILGLATVSPAHAQEATGVTATAQVEGGSAVDGSTAGTDGPGDNAAGNESAAGNPSPAPNYGLEAYPECNGEASESAVAGAKGAYKAGQVSFHEADYEKAILYWEDAFSRDCTAVPLLLNLARAYELSDQNRQAARALATYLERRPDASDRSSVEKRIEKLSHKIEKEDAELAKAQAEAAPSDAPSEQASTQKNARPILPVVITGSGLVLAGTGAALFGISQGTLKDCDLSTKTCTNDDATDKAPSALGMRRAGFALLGVGGAALIGGGIYWALSWSKKKDESSARLPLVLPLLSPQYQGISIQSQF